MKIVPLFFLLLASRLWFAFPESPGFLVERAVQMKAFPTLSTQLGSVDYIFKFPLNDGVVS